MKGKNLDRKAKNNQEKEYVFLYAGSGLIT
jgi:hypothetical protein